jgi:hypothetical protein
MSKYFTIILGMVLLVITIPLSAQDTTITDTELASNEIQVALEALSEQLETASNYTSFTSTINDVVENINEIHALSSDTPMISFTSNQQNFQRMISQDDDGEITAQISSSYEMIEGLDNTVISYLVTTDVRYIDGIYYYYMDTADEELFQELQLTGEWEFDVDPESLIGLPIADFENPFAPTRINSLLDLIRTASRMTLGTATINETPFDTLSFSFDGPEFITNAEQFGNLGLSLEGISSSTWGVNLIESLSQRVDENIIIITFYINEDDLLAGFSFEAYFYMEATGASVELPHLQKVVSELNFFRQEILTDINQPIPPIEVPLPR